MRIRRCAILLIEPRERLEFDFDSLLSGGDGMLARREWVALAPHLGAEVALSAQDVALLGAVPVNAWSEFDALAAEHDAAILHDLIAQGLLISDAPQQAEICARDEALRMGYWHGLSAVAHTFGRWQGVTAGEQVRNIGIVSVTDMIEKLGNPPSHFHARVAAENRIALPSPAPTPIDTLLRRRATCRNFDSGRKIPFSTFSHLLHRVFGAQATHAVTADAAIVKKTSPSAGGLHPTEAYLLVQHVENLAAGLYHYHAGDHALEPLRELSGEDAHVLAGRFLAQQDWFANAHALVVLAPRFLRSFWKYRDHAKVYRAVTLDVGHLSQTLQLSATEFGLGAFITAAVNEVDIEHELGLEPLRESPLAVCGFGWRTSARRRTEFDPNHAVWADGEALI